LIALANDAAGTVVERYAYDPWGKRRNPSDWTQDDTRTNWIVDRGYTMHEHLDQFGIINMNGRVYDPLTAMFFSPDPFVQAPGNWLNYNRYAYCYGNPFRYTDPSGEFIFTALIPGLGIFIDAALWGAVIGGAGYTANIAFSDGDFKNWNWKDFGKSVGIGAISGVVTAGIGQMFGAVGSMGIGGEIARAYTHGFANGIISQFTGGDFLTGFVSGGLGSLAGSAFMMYAPANIANSIAGNYAFSGLAGGIGAAATGGNFWQGAATGLMTAGLNHLQQGINSRLSLLYDGDKLSVMDKDGSEVYSTTATSGKGEHMNNPASQHIENLGPIPEGEYSYNNGKWQTMTKWQQFKRLVAGGDWGTHNVPLDVVKNNSTRSGFYLHGGIFNGSAGCIDAGLNIGRIYNLTRLQRTTYVYVNY
jgi:RHS repeat-associated protein